MPDARAHARAHAPIIVCPLADLAGAVARHRPDHVISIGSPGAVAPGTGAAHHTVVTHHDVVDETEPRPDLVHPAPEHARAIIAAARHWDGARPLVIHCRFGVSRSPAAALIALAARRPEREPGGIARALRDAAPFASPNIRLVAAADAVLGRGGALEAAARSIGRGTFVATGSAFALRP